VQQRDLERPAGEAGALVERDVVVVAAAQRVAQDPAQFRLARRDFAPTQLTLASAMPMETGGVVLRYTRG
jgi:hypothetical protein